MRATFIALTLVAVLGVGAVSTALAHPRSAPGKPSSPPPSSGSQTVSFTVTPVILVVVDAHGRPTAVWTNLRSAPSSLVHVVARLGNTQGPDLPVTAADRAVLAQVHWGRPGLAWSAS